MKSCIASQRSGTSIVGIWDVGISICGDVAIGMALGNDEMTNFVCHGVKNGLREFEKARW